MRIISKFHDYYDRVLVHGIDPTLIYKRETKEVELPNEYNISWKNNLDLYYSVGSLMDGITKHNIQECRFLVGFCGKIYPGIYLTNTNEYPSKNGFAYNIDQVITYLRENKKEKFLEGFDIPVATWRKRKHKETIRINLNSFFTGEYRTYSKFFDNYKTPIFIVNLYGNSDGFNCEFRHNVIYLNPRLKNVQFFKAVDPYTAFQNLSMYIGNFLFEPTKNMSSISDKDMLYKKGFDNRSFKKDPQKRKAPVA